MSSWAESKDPGHAWATMNIERRSLDAVREVLSLAKRVEVTEELLDVPVCDFDRQGVLRLRMIIGFADVHAPLRMTDRRRRRGLNADS